MLHHELPPYSPPTPAPDYSYEPISGERTLACAPRSVPPAPESAFIKQSRSSTVVLHNQEENTTIPQYGRGATIAGSVLFDSHEQRISRVVLKIQGKLETLSSEGGTKTTVLIDDRYTLWSNESKDPCPSQIPLSARLPITFKDGEEEWMLPPSYNAGFHGVPGMFVRSSYAIHILITRTLSQKFGFLTKTKRIFIPFNYYPRTRPHSPIIPSTYFFSAVKDTPEEWYQVTAAMKTQLGAEMDPIYSHLFIPASRIYGIRTAIPFHVQLTGSEKTLRSFLQPKPQVPVKSKRPKSADSAQTSSDVSISSSSSPITKRTRRLSYPLSGTFKSITGVTGSDTPSHSSSQTSTPSFHDLESTRPTLRVFLLRQITISSHGGKSWRNQIIGEASLKPVPPPLLTSRYSRYGVVEPVEDDHLDWEGELRINEDFTVGGWQTTNVHVKDFIALAVLPENQKSLPTHGLQLTVPVKLVTDPWSEPLSGVGLSATGI